MVTQTAWCRGAGLGGRGETGSHPEKHRLLKKSHVSFIQTACLVKQHWAPLCTVNSLLARGENGGGGGEVGGRQEGGRGQAGGGGGGLVAGGRSGGGGEAGQPRVGRQGGKGG